MAGGALVQGAAAISIHTPARGVTDESRVYDAAGQISIHTPARGVTSETARCTTLSRFQSTHPRGV